MHHSFLGTLLLLAVVSASPEKFVLPTAFNIPFVGYQTGLCLVRWLTLLTWLPLAVRLAVEDVNNRADILPNTILELDQQLLRSPPVRLFLQFRLFNKMCSK